MIVILHSGFQARKSPYEPSKFRSARLDLAGIAFFRERGCRLYPQIGFGTPAHILPPLPHFQLPLHGREHYRTNSAVRLTRVPAEPFIKVMRHTSYLPIGRVLKLA